MDNKTLKDLSMSLKSWPAWYFYALQDIKNKYARSILGPIWVTISLLVTVFAMGPLYTVIFSINSNGHYYLHLASGLVFWAFIAGTISESCTIFIGNESFIKQTKLPLFVYVFRCLARNIIVLMHNIFIVLLIYFYESVPALNVINIIFNILIVATLLFFVSYIVGVLCARYRDLVPLVSNVLQLCMFLTPIFWQLGPESARSPYVEWNPFYYLITLMREPFFNGSYSNSVFIVLIYIFVLASLTYVIHRKFSTRIVYWL